MLKEALVSHLRLGLVLDVVPSVVVGVPFQLIRPLGFNKNRELYDSIPPVFPERPYPDRTENADNHLRLLSLLNVLYTSQEVEIEGKNPHLLPLPNIDDPSALAFPVSSTTS
jgi:hypothetical protein